MPLPFESREEVLAWICKNQLGRRNLTPEQKKFLIGKQYSVEHRKPGGNGNNQYTTATQESVQEELCQNDTIPPTATENSVRKQIAEQHNVSESYVARSEKFMRGVQIMDQMIPGMQEKILSGQFKVRDADMHRLARADFPNRKQIVHEILHPEDRPAPVSYTHLDVYKRQLQATAAAIEKFADYLIGKDPFRIEDFNQNFLRSVYFRGSVIMSAISAIDIALWDIKGKALGVPVYELLGGKTRDKVRVYASVMHITEDKNELAAQYQQLQQMGFTAAKIFCNGPTSSPDVYKRQFLGRSGE